MSKHQCAVTELVRRYPKGTFPKAARVEVAEGCGMLNHGNSLFAFEHPLLVDNGDGTESVIRWATRRARGRGRLVGAGITAAALMALELRRAP